MLTKQVGSNPAVERLFNAALADMTRAGAMLVPIDGIVILEACSPYALSPLDKIPIIELREQFEAKPVSAACFKQDLRGYDIEVREVYIRLMRRVLDPDPPVMHNSDGELLELHVRILAANRRCEEAERLERNLEGLVNESCRVTLQNPPRTVSCVDRLRELWAESGCAR